MIAQTRLSVNCRHDDIRGAAFVEGLDLSTVDGQYRHAIEGQDFEVVLLTAQTASLALRGSQLFNVQLEEQNPTCDLRWAA